jgi:hypothetical protein
MLAKVELRNELLGWKKTASMRLMSRCVNSLAVFQGAQRSAMPPR